MREIIVVTATRPGGPFAAAVTAAALSDERFLGLKFLVMKGHAKSWVFPIGAMCLMAPEANNETVMKSANGISHGTDRTGSLFSIATKLFQGTYNVLNSV